MSFEYIPQSKEETYELIRRAKSGDEEAKELLICRNTGLVKKIALKFIGAGYELEDLIQVGYIGLLKAVERFDTGYGVMFSTYAVPMILGEVKRYLRDDGRIKVGRQMKQDIGNLKKAQDDFCHVNGRSPKISELAESMGISGEDVLSIMEAADALNNLESLDDPDRPDYDNHDNYKEREEQQTDMVQLKSIIGNLPERERQIIVLRYFKDMTQQQIADLLGISQVQVSRMEKKVLEGLRREMI
ncbi:MAG: sigma-70 family RNA polymerase sigma factor [Anaerovoracaceae bacterium]